MPAHKPAPQLRRTRYAGHESLPSRKSLLHPCAANVSFWIVKGVLPAKSAAVQHSVHPTCGSRRHFQGFFLASGFSCSQTLSTPAHTRVTQTVGRQEENASGLFEGEGVLSQPARTHCAAGRNRKCPQDMTAAQSVLRVGWLSSASTTIAAHTLCRS